MFLDRAFETTIIDGVNRLGDRFRIILDVDTGIDDALAILYALGRDNIELEALTTIYGNVDVDTATRNSLQLLAPCMCMAPMGSAISTWPRPRQKLSTRGALTF